jgi:hypothetical protein
MIGKLSLRESLKISPLYIKDKTMWFEDLLLLMMLASGVFFIGIPGFKVLKRLMPQKKTNPLEAAKERLQQAKLESEAARLDKETEKVYSHLYEETVEEDFEQKQEKRK